jgi:predicted GNAT family N-acyltransferase
VSVLARPTRDSGEVAHALALRERVFCEEQGVSLTGERDGRDPGALHVVALDGERVVGTCRLLLEGETARLGRMAVDPARRGRGVGSAVLGAAEDAVRAAGASRIALHAQIAVRPLYEAHGYRAHGVPFLDEGILHVAMDKRVDGRA